MPKGILLTTLRDHFQHPKTMKNNCMYWCFEHLALPETLWFAASQNLYLLCFSIDFLCFQNLEFLYVLSYVTCFLSISSALKIMKFGQISYTPGTPFEHPEMLIFYCKNNTFEHFATFKNKVRFYKNGRSTRPLILTSCSCFSIVFYSVPCDGTLQVTL